MRTRFLLIPAVFLAAIMLQGCNVKYKGVYISPYGGTKCSAQVEGLSGIQTMQFKFENLFNRTYQCSPFPTNAFGYGSQSLNIAPDIYSVTAQVQFQLNPHQNSNSNNITIP